MTLDRNIRAEVAEGYSFRGDSDSVTLFENEVILELKYRGAMPAEFAGLVNELGLTAQAASKYRTAGAMLGLGVDIPECSTS